VGSRIIQYQELAKYYDFIYQFRDYRKEVRALKDIIRRYKLTQGNSLLDVGCGTGKHIQELRDEFDCTGIDYSEAMLEQARRNASGIEFRQADMEDFDLGRKFDVVLCLFSSIGYVRTYPRLARTLRSFARHLRPGGVAIIEPWFSKADWKKGLVYMRTCESNDLKIARVGFRGLRGNDSVLDERVLVAEKGKGISYYRDPQVMGLFEREKFLRLMREAGFHPRYIKKSLAPGRGLHVGIRMSS
jgi:SAM-dependent methyltransferase